MQANTQESYDLTIDPKYIPEGYEPVAFRPPKRGEVFVSSVGKEVVATLDHDNCHLILRKKWGWPSWLKAAAIYQCADGIWVTSEVVPKEYYTADGLTRVDAGCTAALFQSLFDFTPPPCDDWKQSLRINPNYHHSGQTT